MQSSNATSDAPKIFRTAYGEKLKTSLLFTTPGLTKQAHKAECDINNILARYRKTGVLDFATQNEPQYGDCTGLDFQAAQNTVAKAKGLFAAMPAHLRNRFDNDPAKFLAFVNDERNRNEAEDLGLLKAKPKEADKGAAAPASAPEVSPTAPGATLPPPTK